MSHEHLETSATKPVSKDHERPSFLIRALRKIYDKIVENRPTWDRAVRYRNAREYWRRRGGEQYFEEQEAVLDRTWRSEFMAEEINQLVFSDFLEIGCGYGKQLKNIKSTGLRVFGCDYSHSQLVKLKEYFPALRERVVEADGAYLPYRDKSFDASMSSAVILHNEYPKAQRMISEMIRVSRNYLIHNEDTDVTFSRYGYDMKKTYEKLRFKILKSTPIPGSPDPRFTQFTIVELPARDCFIRPEEVPLQYHSPLT